MNDDKNENFQNSPEDEQKPELNSGDEKESEGNYLSIGIGLGLCFGLLFGQLLFDNLALGISIGLCLGVALGSAFKKKK